MRLRRLADPGCWRGAFWARRAVRQARRDLRRDGVNDLEIAPPWGLPESAEYGVHAVLRRLPATCLERAVVLQRWRLARGDAREIVIGVNRTADAIVAHAWLEGENDRASASFEELMRVPAK